MYLHQDIIAEYPWVEFFSEEYPQESGRLMKYLQVVKFKAGCRTWDP